MSADFDETYKCLFDLAISYVKGEAAFPENAKAQVIASRNASLFGSVLRIVESFLRVPQSSGSTENLTESLTDIKFPNGSVSAAVCRLEDLKRLVQTDSTYRYRHLPTLQQLRWRVDITISSSVLSRVLEPNLILEMELSNGRKVTFEVSVSKFHKMRYTVASILKEIDYLENKMSAIKV